MRNIGLDIARCLAIVMVIISHGRGFFSKFGDVQDLSFNGLLGVELFFVLSGFLIGGIIIRDLIEEKGSLLRFYSRRWLRTLPAYILVLTVLIIVAKNTGEAYYYDHYLFIQNFDNEKLWFFGSSWSLSIEEWFYILIPLTFFIMRGLKLNNKALFFGICATVIVLSIAAKIFYTYQFNPLWDAGIRKQIFLRMDSLMFGVLLAGIKFYYRNVYEYFSSVKLFTVSTISMIAIILYYVIELEAGRDRINHSIIGRTVLFDMISVSFALMIWSLEKSVRINKITGLTRRIILFIAITSYSVYLIHGDIFLYMIKKFESVQSVPITFLILFGTLVIVYVLAYGMYRYWEMPITKLRDRKKLTITDSA